MRAHAPIMLFKKGRSLSLLCQGKEHGLIVQNDLQNEWERASAPSALLQAFPSLLEITFAQHTTECEGDPVPSCLA